MFHRANAGLIIFGVVVILFGAGTLFITLLINTQIINLLLGVGIGAGIIFAGIVMLRKGAGSVREAIDWILSHIIPSSGI
jgi:hypothetical protein